MSRSLSGHKYDRNKYILQPHNGGSGCSSIEEIKERYGLITESDFNVPGGILAYDAKGNIPSSLLPSKLNTRATTYIDGPTAIAPGAVAKYKIRNYNSANNYNCSFDGGKIGLSADTITLTAGKVAGLFKLTINGEIYKIAIATVAPVVTSFYIGAYKNNTDTIVLGIRMSAQVAAATTHFASDYEVALDANFKEIIHSDRMSSNKTSTTIYLPYNKDAKYHVRCRANDQFKQKSEWSKTICFAPVDVGLSVAAPTPTVVVRRVGNNFTANTIANAFIAEDDLIAGKVEIQLSDDVAFGSFIANISETNLNKVNVSVFTSTKPFLYLRARHTSTTAKASNWGPVVTVNTNDVFSGYPSAYRYMVENSNNSAETGFDHTGFGSSMSYDTGNDELLVCSSDTVGKSKIAVLKRTDRKWRLKQLVANNNANETRFGLVTAVSADGKVMAVGTPGLDGLSTGNVKIYTRVDDQWVYEQTVTGGTLASEGSAFGGIVGLSSDGSTLMVGSNKLVIAGSVGTGAFYVYNRIANNYTLKATVKNPDATVIGAFPSSAVMSVNGQRIAVGFTAGKGCIRIYEMSADIWTEVLNTKPTINLPQQAALGYSISASSNLGVIAVCDRYYSTIDTAVSNRQGALFVLRNNGSTWILEDTLKEDPSILGMQVGARSTVSEDGNTITMTVGDGTNYQGHVSVFNYVAGVWSRSFAVPSITYDRTTSFGVTAHYHLPSNELVVGDSTYGGGAGALFVFTAQEKDLETIAAATDKVAKTTYNGFSLAISSDGNTAISAAHRTPITASPDTHDGRTFFYEKVNGVWSVVKSIDSEFVKGTVAARVGFSVDISGNGLVAVVGAPGVNTNRGAVVIYRKTAGVWNKEKLIDGPVVNTDSFGAHVSMSNDGTRIVVSSYRGDANASGSNTYVFKYTGSDWTEETRLKATQRIVTPITGVFKAAISTDCSTIVSYLSYTDLQNGKEGEYTIAQRNGTTWTYINVSIDADMGRAIGSDFSKPESISVNHDGTRISVVVDGFAHVMALKDSRIVPLAKLSNASSDVFSNTRAASSKFASDGKKLVVSLINAEDGLGEYVIFETADTVNFKRQSRVIMAGKLGAVSKRFSVAEDAKTIMTGLPNAMSDKGAVFFID